MDYLLVIENESVVCEFGWLYVQMIFKWLIEIREAFACMYPIK